MEKQFDENEEDLLMSIIDSDEDEINLKSIHPKEKMDLYQMHYIEDKHWYFKYRIDVLKGLTDRFLKKHKNKDIDILDIGVGTGTISKYLENFGNCIHIDCDKEVIDFNKKMNKDLKIYQANLPWNMSCVEDKKFDYIILYNVLEYIEKDEWTVEVLSKLLKENGKILLSTLSSETMIGANDKLYGVKRRYNLERLEIMFAKASLNPEFYTFFENSSMSRKISDSTDKMLNEDTIFFNFIPKDNTITYEYFKDKELKTVLKKKLKSGNQLFLVLNYMTEKEGKKYLENIAKKEEIKLVDKIINKIALNKDKNEQENMSKEEIDEAIKEMFNKDKEE